MEQELNELRELVSIRKVDAIRPIEGADFIEEVVVDGWHSIVKKGEYSVGDDAVYIEIDAALNVEEEDFSFLAKQSPKKLVGPDGAERPYHVLRTKKLRGVVSQGLLLPVPEAIQQGIQTLEQWVEEKGIFKYEKPVPNSGNIKDNFPRWIKKTDSLRVQNIPQRVFDNMSGGDRDVFVATQKLDGSSLTVFRGETGELGIASRNWVLDPEGDSVFHQAVKKFDLGKFIPPGGYIQGEVFGPGIQGNPLKQTSLQFRWFDTSPDVIPYTVENDLEVEFYTLSVPEYFLRLPETVEEMLAQVDGLESRILPDGTNVPNYGTVPGVLAEGVVWWDVVENAEWKEFGGRAQFKVISNRYLIKQKD